MERKEQILQLNTKEKPKYYRKRIIIFNDRIKVKNLSHKIIGSLFNKTINGKTHLNKAKTDAMN